MEQEQSTNQPQGSHPETKGHKTTTSIRIEPKSKQSQKQKKKALKNQQIETTVSPEPQGSHPEPGNETSTREAKTEEAKPKGNPW